MEEFEPKIKKPETKEKEPKISYEFFYVSHRTVKDFENLEKAFEEAKIYVPEGMRWNEEISKDFNDLSQGKVTATELAGNYLIFPDSSRFKEFQIIENSKKPIVFVDLTKGHELLEMEKKSRQLKREAISMFEKGESKLSIQKMREKLKVYALFSSKREEAIRENLKSKIGDLVENSPELKVEKNIKVLVRLGPVHTQIYHIFKKEKPSTSWKFSYLPDVNLSEDEALRRLLLTKKKEVSDELLARALIETLAGRELLNVTDDTNKLVMVLRKLSSKLNLKDIEEISKKLGEDSKKTVIDCLKERGIKIPRTKRETDEMLRMKKEM